jgi:hypothetical protein
MDVVADVVIDVAILGSNLRGRAFHAERGSDVDRVGHRISSVRGVMVSADT